MIGKSFRRDDAADGGQAKGFDDYELRLGDVMRGERATMGKSLLDVQRELKIKASYIAAIENADPSASDTPGFIAGYVRSYARYLKNDPDETLAIFCKASGFAADKDSTARPPSLVNKLGQSISYGGESRPLSGRFAMAIKTALFCLFWPFLAIIDFFIQLPDYFRSRELGSSRSFQRVNASTTDWWSILSILVGIVSGVLFFFSEYGLNSGDITLRILLSLLLTGAVTVAIAWFNPRMIFARLILLFSAPIFVASIFGVTVSVGLDGQLVGGAIDVADDPDPISVVVSGLLCALAMVLHKVR